MNDFLSLTQLDLQQMFSDWGTTVPLEEVLSVYDPLSGVMQEEVSTKSIPVLPHSVKIMGLDAPAATDTLLQRVWFVRVADLPEGTALQTARIVVEGIRFEIRSVQETHIPGLVLIQCLRDGASP